MLKIDCLLINTEVAETVKQIIGYLGHKGIAEGKDVSFRSMYRELRKNGVEIDLETAAHIYANELPLHDARFTPVEDLKYDTGQWFDQVVRSITLQEPKKGEQEIGELSPAQAAVKAFANAFSSNVSGNETTKSILRTLEDVYKSAGKRMLGELPNKTGVKDERTASEIIEQALDKESIGYRNKTDGTLNGLRTMHDEVRKEIAQLTKKMEATGDQDKIEQWNNYAKSLEDASYTMLLSSNEAKTVLHESLADGGFTKQNKEGKEVVDWQKLTGNINSYEQLRDNVVNSLMGKGIDEDVAKRVADSMSKEFRDIRGKILEKAERERQRVSDTWDATKSQLNKNTVAEIVKDRLDKWKNYEKLKGEEAPLEFTQNEAKYTIADALKNTEMYSKEVAGKNQIDWQEMASARPDEALLSNIVSEHLESLGMSKEDAGIAAESMTQDYYELLSKEIDDRAKKMLDTRQNMLDREASTKRSELSRLAELHDLGIFDGAHDKLLAHVLGIEEGDRQAMDDVKQYAEQMSRLSALMNGNDFLVPSMQREVAHQIQQIIARNIENKTRTLKVMSTLNKIYQVENSSLVSGYRNIIENHLSGLLEYATTKANLRQKLGKQLMGNKSDLRDVMFDTWKSIAKGGNEFGLAPYQVGGTQLRVSDQLNMNKMKNADWSKPKTWVKGAATAVMTVPRAFLSGTDGMFKTGMYRLHFLSGMHDALTATGAYTKDEATALINDAMYGPGQLEKARIKAKELYDLSGINYVSKKEINITANELLHENLLQGSEVTPDMIKEVQNSAFRMAGLGMGHESNNPMSKLIQSSKLHFQRTEAKAFAEGDYSMAASQRMWNTVINSVALRFAASQANWAWIKLEQSGLGLISSVVHYQMGKGMNSKDMLKPENIIKQAEHYQKARQSAYRGAVGLALNGLFTGVAIPMLAQALNPDEKDPVQTLFEDMEDNYLAKAMFLKMTPIWGLGDYFYHKNKKGVQGLTAAGDVLSNISGFGDSHSSAIQFAEAMKSLHSKSKKVEKKGYTKLGQLMSNNLPHVPFYRQGRDVLQTADYFARDKDPMYNYPDNFMQGLLGGGVVEDVAETIPSEYLPEFAEGWGK